MKKKLYPAQRSFEMCHYNLWYFMSLGWMIDESIMDLCLNQANKKGIKYNNNMLKNTEGNDFHLYKRPLQVFQPKK